MRVYRVTTLGSEESHPPIKWGGGNLPLIVRYLLANMPSRQLPDSNRGNRGCNPAPVLSVKLSWAEARGIETPPETY